MMLSGLSPTPTGSGVAQKLPLRLRDVSLPRSARRAVCSSIPGHELRKCFASFATQVYCSLGLYQYGEAMDDDIAISAANACIARLIALQGPHGEWPWFYSVGRGTALTFTKFTQFTNMAWRRQSLHHAIMHNVLGAREAWSEGFNWIFGENELGQTMLRPELHLILDHSDESESVVPEASDSACFEKCTLLAGVTRSVARSLTALTSRGKSAVTSWVAQFFGHSAVGFHELTDRMEFSEALSTTAPL